MHKLLMFFKLNKGSHSLSMLTHKFVREVCVQTILRTNHDSPKKLRDKMYSKFMGEKIGSKEIKSVYCENW